MAQSEMKGTGPGNKSTSVARRAAAKKCCKKAFARKTMQLGRFGSRVSIRKSAVDMQMTSLFTAYRWTG